MGIVIVAIPSSDDRVWSVSSEKKPHLTLLYLGDDVSPEVSAQIVQFVEHAAATVLNRFYLEIDKRGTLGKDNADVVFFKGWDLPDLKRFRSYLLMDNTIKKTYLAAEQFPDWLPHLTLGYPTKPAKKLKDDGDRLYSIHFDKIAVWFGDFGGPEFELKKYEHPEVAMSAASPAVENILRHYGVKGMKWGQRKERLKAGLKNWAHETKIAFQDAGWENHVSSVHGYVEAHNAAADHFNTHIDRLNNSPKYRDKNLNERKHAKLRYDYDRDAEELMHRANEAAAKSFGPNASKTKEVVYNRKTQNMEIRKIGGKKEHVEPLHPPDIYIIQAATTQPDFDLKFKVRTDSDGKIIQVNWAKMASMAQADGFVGDFLEHYGTKGMKWGVRKSDPPAPGTVRVTDKKKKLKAEGGKGFETHPDAVKAATSKQKLKKSGAKTLSNNELRELATRMNLEKQVRELSVADKQANSNPAARFVKGLLKNSGKQEAQKASNSLASKGVEAMMKK